MSKHLWCNDNGSVCCTDHIGYSAKAHYEANPKARTLYGGCDTWHKMTKTETTDWAQFLAEQNYTELCESCRYEETKAQSKIGETK